MKFRSTLVLLLCVASSAAFARDTEYMLPISEVLTGPEQAKFADVKFYFGKSVTPPYQQKLGEVIGNKKTNALNKSDEEACHWVAASVLIEMAERAKSLGGNAVVNIRSFYKKNERWDNALYECHAGATVAGVTLKGDVVKSP
ncbi:excinuclease ATPase subunit [Niveibacterium sp. SC-1]|uniref:excinuclease ATPase subunit n=1 Tax=Niveibacterium sp. SC-1 TaxID=3135646 RepID=UPI00311D8128